MNDEIKIFARKAKCFCIGAAVGVAGVWLHFAGEMRTVREKAAAQSEFVNDAMARQNVRLQAAKDQLTARGISFVEPPQERIIP